MRCSEVRDRIAPFLEGTLPPTDTREMEAHLAGCDACQDHLSLAEQPVFNRPCAPEMPAGFEDRLLHAVIAQAERPLTWREKVHHWLTERVAVSRVWVAVYVVGLAFTVTWGAFGSCAPSRTEGLPLPTVENMPAPKAAPEAPSQLAPVNYRQVY